MSKSKLIRTVDNQIYFVIFLTLLWTQSILLEYFRGLLLNLPFTSAIAGMIVPLIMIIFFVLSLGTMVEQFKGVDITFTSACLVVYSAHYLLFPNSRYYYDRSAMDFMFATLPFYFVGIALNGEYQTRILNLFYKASVLTVYAFIFYRLFVSGMDSQTLRHGDMSSAYNLLPHVCLICAFLMRKPCASRAIPFALGFLMVLLCGSRGPVLCILVFTAVMFFLNVSLKNPKLWISLILLAAVAIIFGNLIEILIEFARDLASDLGLSTRVLDKYQSGTFAVSDGRVDIRERVMAALAEEPILGLGIYGDRHVAGGQYAHNVFVEILANYGYLIGAIFLICLAVLLLRALRFVHKKKESDSLLILLLLLGCNLKLFVSGTYIAEPFFFFLIGYAASLVRRKRYLEAEQLRSKRIAPRR